MRPVYKLPPTIYLKRLLVSGNKRAGDGIRTHEYQLGRLMPYHLATPACGGILPQSETVIASVFREAISSKQGFASSQNTLLAKT